MGKRIERRFQVPAGVLMAAALVAWPARAGSGTRVAAGDSFACAIRDDGTVWCWGSRGKNPGGERGEVVVEPPRRVGGVTSAVDVAAAGVHACAVESDGDVRCWGDTRESYVATTGWWETDEIPRIGRDTGMPPADDVSTSGDLACIAGRDGTVWCWGWPWDPELEDESRPRPLLPEIRATSVSQTRGNEICVTERPGRVACLPAGEQSARPRIRRPRAPGRIVSLSSGPSASCMTLAGGSAWCTGDDGKWGTLGAGGAGSSGRLVRVALDAPLSEVAVGSEFACGRGRGEDVWCWGSNRHGQLGGALPVPDYRWDDRPVRVDLPGPASTISTAGERTCAVVGLDRQVWCWGDNLCGAADGSRRGVAQRPVRVGRLSGVRSLVSGHTSTCAVLGDGSLRCWGDPDDCEHSENGEDILYRADALGPPRRLRVPVRATSMSMGSDGVACGIDIRGRGRCAIEPMRRGRWDVDLGEAVGIDVAGLAAYVVDRTGRLGGWWVPWQFRPEDRPSGPVPATTRSGDPVDAVRRLAAGANGGCVVRSDGEAWCWGREDPRSLEPVRVLPVRGIAGVREIAVTDGGHRSDPRACAVDSSGAVRCWTLEAAPNDHESWTAGAPIPGSPDLGTVVELAAGWGHVCARTARGEVWCWGAGDLGRFGVPRGGSGVPLRVPWPASDPGKGAGQ